MSKRLEIILSELSVCDTFADIGCDHGYVAKAMLDAKKCNRVIVSDISAECLQKAENLLKKTYPDKFCAVVSDGFEKVGKCDLALIAGMGGELIVNIIEKAMVLPDKLVLQPMKNADKVRRALISSGYKIVRDYTFEDEKFYDIISAEKGNDFYTDEEYEFGRDNLKEKGYAFCCVIENKINKLMKAAEKAGDSGKRDCSKKIKIYTEILK